ncbi:hypothetical protein LJC59_00960 [Desulfovibrio sp. OttesenSCG-928-A18]|nr:hypothetical protein [Desulfovibrio sp. OttesenSCG-928-A18]
MSDKTFAVISIDHNDIAGSISQAVEEAKNEFMAEIVKGGFLISAKDTLFIHSPAAANEIKRIVVNGVEIPTDGVQDITFTAYAADLCNLQINRLLSAGSYGGKS